MDGRSLGKTGGVELHDRAVVRHWVADLRLRLLAAAMERDAYILKVPACVSNIGHDFKTARCLSVRGSGP